MSRSSISRSWRFRITFVLRSSPLREPDDQPWLLCEPISFLDIPGYEDRLFGASKLNLMPHPDDREDAESYHAEKDDLTFLLDRLCQWSSGFGVDWTIQIEGAEIGSIESGECESCVRDAIEAMVDLADELGEFL